VSLSSYASETLVHPAKLALDKSGVLVSVTREQANWGTINFSVRRLIAGQSSKSDTQNEEAVLILILLAGKATVDWGEGRRERAQGCFCAST
jgi:5-deoxy-D-glucuronate isomerase